MKKQIKPFYLIEFLIFWGIVSMGIWLFITIFKNEFLFWFN